MKKNETAKADDNAANAGQSTPEAYSEASGSTLAELIAAMMPDDVTKLWAAAAARHAISKDLEGKFSANAEVLHLKKLRQGRVEPEEWRPESELRQYYRVARTGGRRKALAAFAENEAPVVSEIFAKLRAHLEGLRTEVSAAETAFFADYGVEREPSLAAPLDRHLRAIESAEAKLRGGSFHDVQGVLGEFFGSAFQAGRMTDAEIEGAAS